MITAEMVTYALDQIDQARAALNGVSKPKASGNEPPARKVRTTYEARRKSVSEARVPGDQVWSADVRGMSRSVVRSCVSVG
jgi:hypothetical protein